MTQLFLKPDVNKLKIIDVLGFFSEPLYKSQPVINI